MQSRLVGNVRRAISWWLSGLRAALPACVTTAFAGDQRIVRLRADNEGRLLAAISLSAQENEDTASVVVEEQSPNASGQAAHALEIGRTHPVIVECPPAQVLVRRITLPAGAIGELDEALKHNLSTWTPFAIDDVYVAAETVSAGEEQAVVELRLVPKARVEPLLIRIQAVGFRPDCLALGAGSLVDLNAAKKRSVSRNGKIDAALVALAALLMLMVGGSEWHLTGVRLEYLRNAISHQSKQLILQKNIEMTIEKLEQRAGFVAAKRDSQGSLTELLAFLSRDLPAAGDVQEFGWAVEEGRLLIVAPMSSDPAKHLEASPRVQVTRVEMRGKQSGDKALYEIGLSLRRGTSP